MRKILTIAAAIVVGVALIAGFQWYKYVTNTDSPYDEIGIDLNNMMPGPINKWGCDRLRKTFGNVLPPYGCQAPEGDGRQWR